MLGRFGAGAGELGEDPLFGVGDGRELAPLCPSGALIRPAGTFSRREKGKAFYIHQRKARGVPQFVAEIFVAFGTRQIEFDIAPRAGQCGHGEAQRVGTVGIDAVRILLAGVFFDLLGHLRLHQAVGAFGNQIINADAVDDVERIEHIALRLRHFLAVFIAHQAGHIHIVEGNLTGEVVGHHHHPRHPEEDDVKAGHQHAGWDVVRKAAFGHRRFIRPALGGKREHGRREPGFQHVGILPQRRIAQTVLGAHFCFVAAHINFAGLIKPRRDAMPPPQLAADAPVLDIFHPVPVGVDPVRRHEFHLPRLN